MKQCTMRRIPVSGTFELTSRCNFNCKMCYIHTQKESASFCPEGISEAETGKRELTASEWITLGKEAKAQQMLFLLLTGGEPLARSDFREIYDGLYQMGFLLSINTNGSLWTSELIEWMRRRPPLQINVTLYGSSRDTYGRLCGCPEAFEQVKHNILQMKRAGFNIRINVTVTKLNVTDLTDILEFANQHELEVNGTSYLFPAKNCAGNRYRLDASTAGIVRVRLMQSVCMPEELQALTGTSKVYAHEELQALTGMSKVYMPEDLQALAGTSKVYMHEELQALTGMSKVYAHEDLQVLSDMTKENGHTVTNTEKGNFRGAPMKCSAGKSSFWITWDGKLLPCGMLASVSVPLQGEGFAAGWRQLIRETDRIRMPVKCISCNHARYCMICGAAALAEGNGDVERMDNYICRMTEACMKSLTESYFRQINQIEVKSRDCPD